MTEEIEAKIIVINNQRVILDSDLAELYGVSTKRLNEQITRNFERFPPDFMFQLNNQEVSCLRSQIATSKKGRGGRRYRPRVFSEYGTIMAVNVLNSKIAISASIMLVRVFVRLKEITHQHSDLKQRLQVLEQKVAKGFADHEEELREIRFLISRLEQVPENKKRRIGF